MSTYTMLFVRQATIPIVFLMMIGCTSEKTIDKESLTKELDSLKHEDQKIRAEWQNIQQEYGWSSPEMQDFMLKLSRADSTNLSRLQEIIEEVGGYPGKSLVGGAASKAAFFILQHAPDSIQEQYYPLIIEAGKSNELDKGLAAMYQDRYLMHKGESQIFGTQIWTAYEIDSLTGENIERSSVWPIADTTKIDSVRMWNGLGPLEQYLNSFGLSRWE